MKASEIDEGTLWFLNGLIIFTICMVTERANDGFNPRMLSTFLRSLYIKKDSIVLTAVISGRLNCNELTHSLCAYRAPMGHNGQVKNCYRILLD